MTPEREAGLSWEGQLLTQTGDVARWWKEHPANTCSWEEAKSEDFGVDSFISLAEVTEVVKKVARR